MFKRYLFCMLCVLPLLSGAAFAEKLVSGISIDGLDRVEIATVRDVLTSKVGEKYSLDKIDDDVRAIYALGSFKDVEVASEDANGTVNLQYTLIERPLVRKIRISGNKELKNSKVRSALTMRTPTILHPKDLQASIIAIKQLYVDDGFYAVEVTSQIEKKKNNEATVVFKVVEGTKVTIDDIEFDGNKLFSDRKLRGFMQTKEWWIFSWLTSGGTYNEGLLGNDIELIKDEYFNKGYIKVRVKQPLITLSADREEMDILIEIDEGDQYVLGKMAMEGDLLLEEDKLIQMLRFESGDVFSRKQLRADIKRLNDYYANRGYAYVNVSPSTLINKKDHTVDVTFHIEQGVEVHIGLINIGGNSKTRDKVIRREITVVEGDLYSVSRIESSKKRLDNLGFFSEVNVDTVAGDSDEVMDVQVDVKEQPTGTFSVGFGYSSVDGLIGQGSVSQDNFLGRALKLNLSGSFGGESMTYRLGILDPYFMDKNLALGFDVYSTDRDWDDYSEKAIGGAIKLGVPITYDTRTFFIYKYEEKEIYDVYNLASPRILEQEGTSTLSSVYGSITKNTTDYRPDPTRGYMSEFSLEFAGIGGTEHFAKTILDHRHFIPIKWGVVFSAHGQIGFVHKITDDEIPIDERFYLGGLSTVRGFDSREVGPWEWAREYKRRSDGSYVIGPDGKFETVESTSDRTFIGGVKEAYFNFEIIFPLLREAGLKGVIFFDVGNSWDQGEEYFSEMRYSAGAGIRWKSPLGPLRLEWGYNLDPEEWEDDSKFDFSIGKFF